MEYIVCNLCGVDDSELVYTGRDRLLGGVEPFNDVRCQRCGLIYLNPRPSFDEILKYYPPEYEPFSRNKGPQSWYTRLNHRVAYSKRRRIASRGLSRGTLLDVGCGNGDFLNAMRDAGWDVYGVDLSPEAVDDARERGLQVHLGQLFDSPFPEASFDLVTMWDVLEHVHDPIANLKRVVQLLKPGGQFVVTLPNPHSLDFRVFGPIWTGLDVPRHLYVYPRSVLLSMFKQVGLEYVSMRCVTGGQRVSTWSIEWWIDEKITNEKHMRRLKKVIYNPVWYWLWRPFYYIIDLFNQGSSITYTCRRLDSNTVSRNV